MALIAQFQQTFGPVPAYYYLRSYRIDVATQTVRIKLEVYKDVNARTRFKSATDQKEREAAKHAAVEIHDAPMSELGGAPSVSDLYVWLKSHCLIQAQDA